MEDDEETRSQTSHEPEKGTTDLYSTPMHEEKSSSGVTVVTVAAPPPTGSAPPPITPPAPLTLALPIQQYSSSSTSNARPTTLMMVNGAGGVIGGGREDCWSEGATSVLIDAWGERYLELSRGNLKQKHWKEVADIVNNSGEDHAKVPKTDIQCKNRIDTVKKKYKMEKSKVVSGLGPSRWVFFERMDRLIGPSAAVNSAVKVAVSVSPVNGQDAAVPVGIPFGVRQQPLPLAMHPPMYQTPPHYRPPSQQHSVTRNFPTPTPLQQRFSHPSMNNNNNHGYGSNAGNSSGRNQVMHQQQQHYQQQQQEQFRRAPPPVESDEDEDEDEDEMSNESGDSLPPARPTEYERRERVRNVSGGVKKGKKGKKGVKAWGNSVRELTKSILKFGEAYEMAESAKLEHIVEMEKQRMKFAKDLELQRMKFLMKTQLELSQFNGESGGGSRNSGGSSGRSGGSGGVARGLENNNLH